MKNVFVLVGDYWHSAASIKPMADMLFDNDGWNYVYTEKPEDIYELKDTPDLIVTFKDPIENDQIPTAVWCDDKWNEKITDMVENKGVGLIMAHAAVTDLDADHVIIKKMIQSMFIAHPDQCPMSFVKTAEHPITEGISDFSFPDIDEQYQMKMIENTDVQILADTETQYGREPAVWVKKLGKGRICCITPAHTTANLTCGGFVKLMQNAVKWCSR